MVNAGGKTSFRVFLCQTKTYVGIHPGSLVKSILVGKTSIQGFNCRTDICVGKIFTPVLMNNMHYNRQH